MAKTIEQFKADIKNGKPDAKQTYEAFQARTKEHITQLKEVRSLVSHNPYHLSEK
jgi:hypothetical protein